MMCLIKTWFYPRNLALLVMAASIGALAFAYISQYGFNLQPCVLCLQQRKPYFAVLVMGGLALLFPKYARLFLILCATAFLTGSGIAAYHIGVEQGWWSGTPACGGGNLPANATIEQLQQYLSRQPVVRCDVPAWKLFGLSMTGYNFLYSSALTTLTIAGLFKSRMVK